MISGLSLNKVSLNPSSVATSQGHGHRRPTLGTGRAVHAVRGKAGRAEARASSPSSYTFVGASALAFLSTLCSFAVSELGGVRCADGGRGVRRCQGCWLCISSLRPRQMTAWGPIGPLPGRADRRGGEGSLHAAQLFLSPRGHLCAHRPGARMPPQTTLHHRRGGA